jgi:aldose 1-epimerase
LYTLSNQQGARVTLTPLGAAIAGIFVPDDAGRIEDITVPAGGSAGKTIGRYANRIARGELPIDGKIYTLLTNEGRNTLHGGPDGFSKREWEVVSQTNASVEFALQSPDGDQGFPGALECRVSYSWNDCRELRISYVATTSKPTAINLTNHVYFNLNPATKDVSQQQLHVAASAYTPFDDELIPTGEIAPVENTSRDFRTLRALGDEPYDCNFVLDEWNGDLRYAARAFDPQSGRGLVVETTQPGLQLYTGKPGAFALETQHFADSPHHPNFPNTILRPGEVFRSTTVYRC